MLMRVLGRSQRHLVRTPAALGLFAVDMLGASPTLGRTEHNHGIHRTRFVARLRALLNVANLGEDLFEQLSKAAVNRGMRLIVKASHKEVRLVAHALKEVRKFLVRDARKDGGVCNLIAV